MPESNQICVVQTILSQPAYRSAISSIGGELQSLRLVNFVPEVSAFFFNAYLLLKIFVKKNILDTNLACYTSS